MGPGIRENGTKKPRPSERAGLNSPQPCRDRRRRRGLRGFPRRPGAHAGLVPTSLGRDHIHIGGRDWTAVAAQGFKAVLVFPKSVEPITGNWTGRAITR